MSWNPTLFASPASLIRFLVFGQLFLFALRRCLEPDAEDVVPGTDQVVLSWDVHLRESEAKQGCRGPV